MKLLPLEFRKNGFNYRQVWRDEDYAIYEQSDNSRFVAYEVFRITKNEAGDRGFGFVEASETVPPSTHWGKNAWTVRTLEDAYAKINSLRSYAAQKSAIVKNPLDSSQSRY